MQCCLQFKNIWSHVSSSRKLHMKHVIEGYALLLKNICFLTLPMY